MVTLSAPIDELIRQDSTISLIQGALDRNIPIRECYVDALGPSVPWQARLSSIFPGIKFTVCPKADSLFKIVGAASIIAKVTRDRYIENWRDPEESYVREGVAPVKSGENDLKRKRGDGSAEEDEEEGKVARGSGFSGTRGL